MAIRSIKERLIRVYGESKSLLKVAGRRTNPIKPMVQQADMEVTQLLAHEDNSSRRVHSGNKEDQIEL